MNTAQTEKEMAEEVRAQLHEKLGLTKPSLGARLLGFGALLLGIALTIALLVPLAMAVSIYHGFVLATIWGWFVVPALGAPSLTVPYAIGLMMVVGLIKASMTGTGQARVKKLVDIVKRDALTERGVKELNEADRQELISIFLSPAVILGISYLLHLYVS